MYVCACTCVSVCSTIIIVQPSRATEQRHIQIEYKYKCETTKQTKRQGDEIQSVIVERDLLFISHKVHREKRLCKVTRGRVSAVVSGKARCLYMEVASLPNPPVKDITRGVTRHVLPRECVVHRLAFFGILIAAVTG